MTNNNSKNQRAKKITTMNQSTEGEEAAEVCNGGGKHVFMYSSFCDKCELSFQDWKKEILRKVAFDLVVIELNKILDEMWKERRINRNDSIELYNRMIKRTEGRGYRLHAR